MSYKVFHGRKGQMHQMNKFQQEFQRVMNSPINKIKNDVVSFTCTENYINFSQALFPFNRAVHIYEYNHKQLKQHLESLTDLTILGDDFMERRSETLHNTMAYIHNYLSSQFSLLEILGSHSENLPLKNNLLSEIKIFKKNKISDFIDALRDNIIHEINFSPLLKFDMSNPDRIRVAYLVSDLLSYPRWQKSKPYIEKFELYVIIEDVIEEYHNLMINFINKYEQVIFKENHIAFKEVLIALLEFAKRYNEIGKQDFLPVSEKYVVEKLKYYSD